MFCSKFLTVAHYMWNPASIFFVTKGNYKHVAVSARWTNVFHPRFHAEISFVSFYLSCDNQFCLIADFTNNVDFYIQQLYSDRHFYAQLWINEWINKSVNKNNSCTQWKYIFKFQLFKIVKKNKPAIFKLTALLFCV